MKERISNIWQKTSKGIKITIYIVMFLASIFFFFLCIHYIVKACIDFHNYYSIKGHAFDFWDFVKAIFGVFFLFGILFNNSCSDAILNVLLALFTLLLSIGSCYNSISGIKEENILN